MRSRRAVLAALRDRPNVAARLIAAPALGFLVAFFVVPLVLLLGYSVLPRDETGVATFGFTLEHYRELFDPLYLRVLGRTLQYAAVTTLLCLLIGYPCAYAIARAGRFRRVLLFLFVLPFWTSFLVRTYALMFLIRDGGLVNDWLLALGVVSEPIEMLYSSFAVVLGLVHGFLPFMLLPIYASLEKLDRNLLEAASTLGARPFAQFFRVTLPLTLPGVAVGCALVFVPALGSFLTSDLLGGAKEVLVGNLVAAQFTTARNWPLGAAAAALLVLPVVAFTLLRRDKIAGAAR
jgi:spermidine/putrescine transport system permease protein